MTLSRHYNSKDTEARWYQHWLDRDYFRSVPDDREPFSIVIPPPNVTGKLHMGHMLNNTIQDILIRRARLRGKNACWVPGMDHASIATEAKVVKWLREKGIKKSDLSREEFMSYAWQWKEKYGGIILEQLKQLGASCDWERTRFTLEDSLNDAVIRVFVDLYRKGKIYRGLRMVNWDPVALTALSNEEVLYREEQSRLHYVRYRIEGAEDEWITIATTRPETILGDTAVAVHPDDERYAHLMGKRVIVPLADRSIPLIFDKYVEMEFGTGALKVTPAHDTNDYEIGQRHQLETIDVLNDDGTMSETAGFYVGEDRFKARKLIVKELEQRGHLVKVDDYPNKVGRSERTDAVVEPRLKEQWFMDMKEAAQTALRAVDSGEVTFYPDHFWNMYYNWLNEDNIRDWCISRQLWWGQQIPAWYLGEEIFVAENEAAALVQARERTGNTELQASDLTRDEDVVDTWFSSWLWPISVFDGFERPEELRYYYPTNVLVTGWDIMFFWVARMIMAGYEWSGNLLGEATAKEKGIMPFHKVFFTGMVRDEKRRKMSKSLGNSPEAVELMDRYGADGVRFGMLSSAAAGNDIVFDAPLDPKTKQVLNESKLCEQGQNFCNKMWQALKLLKGWEVVDAPINADTAAINKLAGEWIGHKLELTIQRQEESFRAYRLSEALRDLYNFMWNDFFSEYLEMIKPPYGEPIDRDTLEQASGFFETMMTLLHPFMPFVTEEIWHQLRDRAAGEDCIVSHYPQVADYDAERIQTMGAAIDLISKIRYTRSDKKMKEKEPLQLFVQRNPFAEQLLAIPGMRQLILKRGYLSGLEFTDRDELENTVAFVSGTGKYFLEVNIDIDYAAERARLQKELERQEGFSAGIRKKLENERFVNNAPPAVVERERKKLKDSEEKIKLIRESLSKLPPPEGDAE
ncbi:MAG: valine--tRNA ligase [Bacteroidota bacterium]